MNFLVFPATVVLLLAGSTIAHPMLTFTDKQAKECVQPLDICISLDESTSVGTRNWRTMIEFTVRLSGQFNLTDDYNDEDGSRIAVATI